MFGRHTFHWSRIVRRPSFCRAPLLFLSTGLVDWRRFLFGFPLFWFWLALSWSFYVLVAFFRVRIRWAKVYAECQNDDGDRIVGVEGTERNGQIVCVIRDWGSAGSGSSQGRSRQRNRDFANRTVRNQEW
jgi:hypothetical protein